MYTRELNVRALTNLSTIKTGDCGLRHLRTVFAVLTMYKSAAPHLLYQTGS